MNKVSFIFLTCSFFSLFLLFLNIFLEIYLRRNARRLRVLDDFKVALDDILSDERVPLVDKKRLVRTIVFVYDKSKAATYIKFTERVLNGECSSSGKDGEQYYVGHPDLIEKTLLVYMTALSVAGVCTGQSVRAERIRSGLVSGRYDVRREGEGCFANFVRKLPRISKQHLPRWDGESFFQLGNLFDSVCRPHGV